jgi:RNA polymerase-binding transcription factor DksA
VRRSTTPSHIKETAMALTVKKRETLDRRTARAIEGFLRSRRLTLSSVIRRGIGERQERQEHAGADSDQVASASRTLDDEVRAALVDRANRELVQVDAALELLRERRYGRCRDCGAFIGLARLQSLPFAQRCRPCQERIERVERQRQTLEPQRSLVAVATADSD